MFSDRIQRLRETFEINQIDAFFISNFYNVLYFAGFKTLTTDEREAFVLVTKKNTYLFTDGRYVHENFRLTILNFKLALIEPGKGLFFHLQNIITEEKITKIGIENEDIRLGEYDKFVKVLKGTSVIPIDKTGITIRENKEQEEIERIKKACEITDECLKEIVPSVTVGMTEKKLAFNIEMWIKQKGHDLAFDPIVAVNKNSALPHYHTKDGKGIVEKESVILIDFGVKFEDYMSDITRMVFMKPTSEMLTIYLQLLEVQEKSIRYVSLEKDPKAIDSYCRELLKKKGLPNFSHSLGHGVGLEIHEYPKISHLSDDHIVENQVFTIEPGVYLSNRWGMRIEDTVVMKNGKAEVLTKYTKEPTIIKFK